MQAQAIAARPTIVRSLIAFDLIEDLVSPTPRVCGELLCRRIVQSWSRIILNRRTSVPTVSQIRRHPAMNRIEKISLDLELRGSYSNIRKPLEGLRDTKKSRGDISEGPTDIPAAR